MNWLKTKKGFAGLALIGIAFSYLAEVLPSHLGNECGLLSLSSVRCVQSANQMSDSEKLSSSKSLQKNTHEEVCVSPSCCVAGMLAETVSFIKSEFSGSQAHTRQGAVLQTFLLKDPQPPRNT